jgi:hypothetical protein
MSTFRDFLETGRLGPLRGGLSQPEVIELLGEPPARSIQRDPQIWKYGSLELTFRRLRRDEPSLLVAISVLFDDRSSPLPPGLVDQGWMPSPETTPHDLRDLIPGYDADVFNAAGEFPSMNILLKSGVRVYFEDGALHAVRKANELAQPEGKQVSVFLPPAVLALIRKEAAQRKTSIAAVCAEWLAERAKEIDAPIAS